MSDRQLWTIGYAGKSLADFVAQLRAAGVERVVDVRALPLSRKKGEASAAECHRSVLARRVVLASPRLVRICEAATAATELGAARERARSLAAADVARCRSAT